MSFILDALKKNQAEQQDPLSSLSYQQPQARNGLNPWLTTLLIVVMVCNAGVLVWVLWEREPAPASTQQNPKPSAQEPAAPANNSRDVTPAESRVTQTEPTPQPAAPPPVRRPQPQADLVAPPIVIGPSSGNSATSSNIQVEAVNQGQEDPAPTPALANLVALTDLPAAQQQRYAALEYSIHIFHTDAPQDSLVMINGARTQVGDRVAGLEVAAITETSVIYAETTPQGVRHVVVPVVDQLGQ